MSLYTIFARIYQAAFKLVVPFFPWREPELLEGPGSVLGLPELLRRKGIGRLLVVTDRSIRQLGLMDPMLARLDEEKIAYAVYDGTVPNPTIGNIEEALSLYRERGCQAILAFGGGSPMDCAKGVGARVARPRKPVAAMKGLLKVGRRLPPFIAVPTTAGTGSEATLAAVISNPATHEKYAINDHALIPRFAVLDPELTLGLPPAITSTTGMDALTHAVEAFIGGSNFGGTERAAIEATRLIMENLVAVYRDGRDPAGRGRLLRASYLAGYAFTRAYVGYVHAIAHTLGGFYGVPHGLANSVILPHVLEYYGKPAWKRLALLARKSGAVKDGQDDEATARAFIDRIRSMNREMGIPARIDAIKEADVPLMVSRALAEANPLYPVPRILGRAEVSELYAIVGGARAAGAAGGRSEG